jgi:hypothetical protein
VLTLPFPLRAQLAYEPGLLTLVARVFEDSLLENLGLGMIAAAAEG